MSPEKYSHTEIEAEAQKKWEESRIYETDLADTGKKPYYLLIEFPYPSGDLHVGHWYAFSITDIFARFKRMQGMNVLFPFGFDAFGLPAENAAIKRGLDPMKWTYENMESMRKQVRSMGTSFDWSKEVVTCSPEYYKWTQWLFSRLFEHGLAERKKAAVKWCPHDQTVLANEQVIDGKCERCGHEVEERLLTQWFLSITKYADRLIADLDGLPWREDIKDAQRAWIGKSEGAKIPFTIFFEQDLAANEWRDEEGNPARLVVFTTRPDTLFGVTYVVVAPEHPWVTAALDGEHDVLTNEDEVRAYVEATKLKTERERMENKEKTGAQLKGVMAVNPLTKEQIPVYVADYVLATYGTGAVMAVPAHDERDHEFAERFNLPIKEVVTDSGTLVDSGTYTGKQAREAMGDIVKEAGGERTTTYRLRDWLVSRQRYWGCPIPVVYDPEGKAHLVPSEHLPWKLPEDVDFQAPSGTSPLATSRELKERVERIFGEGWTPEYDTLDTFVDSSWYYARYLSPHDDARFANADLMKNWLPVDRYSGGSEHVTMHLLYSRFFYKALYDLALVPTPEPFYERFNRGLIMGPDGQKMSKSKGNIINPDDFVEKYGADAVRMYLSFIGPYNEPGSYPWKPEGVESMRRFLDRIYALRSKVGDADQSMEEQKTLARAADKMGTDIERFKLNTAVSSLMIALNSFESMGTISRASFDLYLRLLAPFAPYLSEALFENGNSQQSIHTHPWPTYDASLLEEETVGIGVQVAGKRRAEIFISPTASEEEAVAQAQKDPNVSRALEGKEPSKVIYRPGKILNLIP